MQFKSIEYSYEETEQSKTVTQLAMKGIMKKSGNEGELTYHELYLEMLGTNLILNEEIQLTETKPNKREDVMAGGREIVTILDSLLGDQVHILHPDINSLYSIFSEDEEASAEAAYSIALKIDTLVSERAEINANGLNQTIKKPKPLNKPIVTVLNTRAKYEKKPKYEIKMEDIDTEEEHGVHWLALIILPKNYVPLDSMAVRNKQPNCNLDRVYLYDSLHSNRGFPPQLIHTLKNGSYRYRDVFHNTDDIENPQISNQLFTCIDPETTLFIDNTKGHQQGIDMHCAFWAIYNIIMTLLQAMTTSGVNFTAHNQSQKSDLKRGYFLGDFSPNYAPYLKRRMNVKTTKI